MTCGRRVDYVSGKTILVLVALMTLLDCVSHQVVRRIHTQQPKKVNFYIVGSALS
jgi:hypothetical protein